MINSHNLPNPQKILLRLSLSPTSPASSLFCFKRNILERLKNTSSVKTYLVENVAAFANLQRTSQHQGTAFTLPFTFLNLSFRTQHNTQVVLREGFTKKKVAVLLDFVQITILVCWDRMCRLQCYRYFPNLGP